MVSAETSKNVKIWNLNNFTEILTFIACDTIKAMEILKNNQIAFGCMNVNDLKIYNIFTGQLERNFNNEHQTLSLKMLPDGNIACGLGSNKIKIWNPITEIMVKELGYTRIS